LQAIVEANYSRLDEHADRGRTDMRRAGTANSRVPAPPASALLDIFSAATTPKGHPTVEQSLGGPVVFNESGALVKDVSVPVKAKRLECSQDVGRSVWGLPQGVDVLDAHEPFAAGLPRMQVASDRSRQRSEV
jgi:hypothetical protein